MHTQILAWIEQGTREKKKKPLMRRPEKLVLQWAMKLVPLLRLLPSTKLPRFIQVFVLGFVFGFVLGFLGLEVGENGLGFEQQ